MKQALVENPRNRLSLEMQLIWAGLLGLVSGVTSAMFGVGGGIVMVPAMIYLMQIAPKQAVGTSLAVIIPTALVGVWQKHQAGTVLWSVAMALVVPAMIGAWAGEKFLRSLSDEQLKRGFGALLILAGVRMVLGK